MVAFSVSYIISAIPFYRRLGYANMVNLCAGTLYCHLFVGRYFQKASSTSSVHSRFYKVPPLWVISVTSAVIYVSERHLNAKELAL